MGGVVGARLAVQWRSASLCLIFMLYGLWQMGRGVLEGSPVLYTLKFFIFNYYPIYLFLGLWIGLRAPDFLPHTGARYRLDQRYLRLAVAPRAEQRRGSPARAMT